MTAGWLLGLAGALAGYAAGLHVAIRDARRSGLDPSAIGPIWLAMLAAGALVGLAAGLDAGMAAAAGAAVVVTWLRRMPTLLVGDAVAPSVALAFALAVAPGAGLLPGLPRAELCLSWFLALLGLRAVKRRHGEVAVVGAVGYVVLRMVG